MTPGQGPRNLAQSVRARLVNYARVSGEESMRVLIRFANERFLYRLSRSPHRDRFILKGATLFSVWADAPHRPTRDVDFLASGDCTVEGIVPTFQAICETPVEEDGIVFPPESVRAQERRDEETYPGLHVELTAHLGTARIPLQIDLGFGDVVTPAAEEVEVPTLLDFPRPRLRAYPRETVVAEKLEALVSLGLSNSRMKDFYDLWYLTRYFAFRGPSLAAAIRATFARRGTVLPEAVPLALSATFSGDPAKRMQWDGFLRRGGLSAGAPALEEVIEALRGFLWLPLESLGTGKGFAQRWEPGGPWMVA